MFVVITITDSLLCGEAGSVLCPVPWSFSSTGI
jgi:hypothetical protein